MVDSKSFLGKLMGVFVLFLVLCKNMYVRIKYVRYHSSPELEKISGQNCQNFSTLLQGLYEDMLCTDSLMFCLFDHVEPSKEMKDNQVIVVVLRFNMVIFSMGRCITAEFCPTSCYTIDWLLCFSACTQ